MEKPVSSFVGHRVRRVRLVVDLVQAANGSAPPAALAEVSLDLTPQFAGSNLDDVAQAAQRFRTTIDQPVGLPPAKPKSENRQPTPPRTRKRKSSPVNLEAELRPIDSPHIKPFRLKSETVVGRSRICDLAIQSAKVSRRHVRFYSAGGGFLIEDLGSANKTWVNGEMVENQQPLQDGDTILLGDVTFHYHVVR